MFYLHAYCTSYIYICVIVCISIVQNYSVVFDCRILKTVYSGLVLCFSVSEDELTTTHLVLEKPLGLIL